ncbi:TIGR03086 family metal-binding protein [Saccharothrix longispora]|uniref:TIGR03086 family metal-binding protein n=1 Tax=Saccharothrix longispora TaxID=33920 RepID=UPI0028FDBE1D|nr:TIGR03086 family metal-binding protein [Saccharothrix longispora]MBY8850456.1 TIGR03086 family protein [Saccharothrix sp. MB29]MDU0293895.1 TIGR03086 family metal-binding protein [Saccharothrix longispora]
MDLLDLHRSSIDLNEKLWADLSEAHLDLATPCAGWTVHELLRHQVAVALEFAASARGTTPEEPADDDPPTAYRAASDAAAEAFRAPGFLDRTARFPGYGPRRGKDLVAAHFVDNLVHAWDLSRALGLDSTLDAELAAAAFRMARHYPTTPDVRGPGGAFAMPVDVPADAPITDRLVGLLGRSPRWPARGA